MDNHPQRALQRFLDRLLQRSVLNCEEQEAILSLGGYARDYDAHSDIVSPGEVVTVSCLVARGLAGRFDQMRNGERQITSFYIPGDMCDLHSVVAPKARWSITAISRSTAIHIPHDAIRSAAIRYPAIALAFWRDGTVDASILAKWVGNLGRKDAVARVAHLFCEIGVRTEHAGIGTRTEFQLAATQEQLADAAGITAVHMNRMLQELRGQRLLSFQGGNVEVGDWERLAAAAEFDPAYLMFDGPPDEPASVRPERSKSTAPA